MTTNEISFDSIKDSGTRHDFPTGARRDMSEGKGRYDLLHPILMRRLAKHLENGAKKYGVANYLKGIPLSRYMDSALRHTFKHLEGFRDEDHLAAAIWNLSGILITEQLIRDGRLPKELDDLDTLTSTEPDTHG